MYGNVVLTPHLQPFMTTQDYLKNELHNCSLYELDSNDRKLIDSEGIEAFIYTKLTSKKFRKWAVDESSEAQAKGAIGLNVTSGKPLQFRYPFGGYKLWRMPGSPEVDWAEFFSIAYYVKYLAPIAAAYSPGIEFKFASDDIIIERMDNVPRKDTDAYFNSFQVLLDQFRPHFPSNFKMDIVRIGDLYPDKAEFEQELTVNIEHFTSVYAATVPKEKKQQMYKTSALNIQWDGVQNLGGLTESERQSVVAKGPIYHDAYCAVSKRREFNRGEDKIVIFTTVIPNAIAIGTTKSSVAKFWTGFGVLEDDNGSFKAKILSPTQLDRFESKPSECIETNLINLRNFKNVQIYETSQ